MIDIYFVIQTWLLRAALTASESIKYKRVRTLKKSQVTYGYRQMVRHSTLTAACGGSNPPSRARNNFRLSRLLRLLLICGLGGANAKQNIVKKEEKYYENQNY